MNFESLRLPLSILDIFSTPLNQELLLIALLLFPNI